MKLSIVIACYNAAETISEQLDAISEQQWDHPWEVIIVDNGSSDETVKIVHGYRNRIDNLQICTATEKQGAGYARNAGVKNAAGKYLAFVDADDVVAEGWLASLGNALLENNFVACRMEWQKLNDFRENVLKYKPQRSELMTFGVSYFSPYAGAGTLGIKKSIHDAVGGFDEEFIFGEDIDYCCRVQYGGHTLVFVPEAAIHIRARSTQYQIFKQQMKWAEFDIYLSKKFKQHGVNNYSTRAGIKLLYQHLRNFSPKRKVLWLMELAVILGRLKGSLKYELIKRKLINKELENTIRSYSV